MEADKKKNRQNHTTNHSAMIDSAMGNRPRNHNEINGEDGRSALLSVQSELSSVVQMARILAKEGPPISENEAKKTADNIALHLKASGDAFGEEAVLFQELIPERAKNLLR